MGYSGAFFILVVSVISAFFCEGVLWLLVYRTSSYQNLREIIDRTTKKVESLKTASTQEKKQKNKKLVKEEEFLKDTSRQLNFVKMKSSVVVMVTLTILYSLISSLYDGIPVGKLPFYPIGILKLLTHKGLPGDDLSDCSLGFLYLVCSICNRSNVQKLLGNSPPRAANPFAPQSPYGQQFGQ
mmetsp:Transcript_22108/g.48518  ORF Transcript_22108/g.48518 Transcript_22108/m.48518 type:complete len:183 (-) Transcript_22108:298-846(-)|eukprot:CAMPEP_0118934760 /NCGR_PEP_ID=MMETSP1169-20130426/14090_1 /TAXON_ID=36882 /ORGANISM="Pyramimonas obovata, Strain CCMP722" /LENGTH=182 /DNA_ID=CAMNT_0006877697 /DNA_START=49 /DNA_END=597 /DNA_ORIENTATION=+